MYPRCGDAGLAHPRCGGETFVENPATNRINSQKPYLPIFTSLFGECRDFSAYHGPAGDIGRITYVDLRSW